MNTDCDVIIVGGGLVGLSLACALADKHTVRVLEAGSELQKPEHAGLRVSAISPASRALLTSLGAWERLPTRHCCAFSGMRVWDEHVAPFGDRALEFAGADFGVTPLGHIVHNDELQWALYEVARACNVEMVFDARVDDIAFEASGVRVFSGSEQHTGRLLVGADGGRSKVRSLCGIDTVRKAYGQQGLVCNVRPTHSHESTAWQRFVSTGPVALLPLSSGECSIVWSVDDEPAEQLKALDDAEFANALGDACDHVLGPLEVTSERASFPLSLLRADKYTHQRLVLMGDAAHVVHPLAGQGVNLGFADVATLVDALQLGRQRGDDIGDRYALRKYERARKYENRKMQMAVDGLHHLFGARLGWLQQSRSLGMGFLNQWPSIKARLAKEALGTGH